MVSVNQDVLNMLVNKKVAVDITNWPTNRIDDLIFSHELEMIAYSHGSSIDGVLFDDEDANLYAVTARTGTLFQLLWEVCLPDEQKPHFWWGLEGDDSL